MAVTKPAPAPAPVSKPAPLWYRDPHFWAVVGGAAFAVGGGYFKLPLTQADYVAVFAALGVWIAGGKLKEALAVLVKQAEADVEHGAL